MEKTHYIGLLVLATTLVACHGPRKTANTSSRAETAAQQEQTLHIGDNSEVSLDWAGTYRGLLPCADCPGIRTVLTLRTDRTYLLQRRYLERGEDAFTYEGSFTWDPTGSYITLSEESGGGKFLVGENRLFQLDGDGQRITGELADLFILTKMDHQVRDIYWQLVEINGQSLEGIKLNREPYLRLNTEDRRAEANGGCNGMGGSYELDEEHHRLKFSQLISTKMACENMEIEQQLADVLQRTDSYAVSDDTLQLFRARMAPLAKFRAIYVKD